MKEFVSISYFGVFIRGAQCPQDAFHTRAMAEWMKSQYEQSAFYGQFEWVVKPCVLGRHLTQRAPDLGKAPAKKRVSKSGKSSVKKLVRVPPQAADASR